MTLSGRVAVVTGATSEIGQATALRLAAEGAAVAVTGIEEDKLVGVVANLREVGATVHAAPLDLTRPEAKGAVHGLVKAMAVDLAPYGITVNAVAPGVVETQYVRTNLSREQIEKRLERIPAGRLASPQDCAAAVAHLAAPDLGYVTGQILYVDGGFLSAGVLAR